MFRPRGNGYAIRISEAGGFILLTAALETARLEAAGCNRPKRSRRHELYLPLIVEVPAAFMPWVRMYARWVTLHHFALDDYLMMFCAVRENNKDNLDSHEILTGCSRSSTQHSQLSARYVRRSAKHQISLVLTTLLTAGNLGFGYDTWFIDPQDLTEALRVRPLQSSLALETPLILAAVDLHRRVLLLRLPDTHQSFRHMLLFAHLSAKGLQNTILGRHRLRRPFECDIPSHPTQTMHAAQHDLGRLAG